jgi:hypothetical protein
LEQKHQKLGAKRDQEYTGGRISLEKNTVGTSEISGKI